MGLVMIPALVVCSAVLVGLVGLVLIALRLSRAARRSGKLRFVRRMSQHDRFISWENLESRLQAREGTLIVEQAHKAGVRVWWAGEDVLQAAPMQPPLEEELDYLRFKEPHPFVAWCFERYLHPESGRASLTDPPFSFPPGFVRAAFFKDKFPGLRVLVTVKLA
jgi:hypothetical protein